MMGDHKKFLAVVSVLGVYIGFTAPAYAYLDPGTGSLLLQGLIATIAAGAATVSIYWGKVRSYFSKKKEPDGGHSDEQGKDDE
jgi:hypothetical protein